ncbi:HlyD family secretion protein [Psychrobium sp. nBUS_13]|uniref:HlyD family secretion protein n=1 Tax=Psychrobium sp. nBUS_13 TaxID=3395319 RepID=UPI003EBF9ACC
MTSLFRPESINSSRDIAIGTAYLKLPISYGIYTLFLVASTITVVAILLLNNYSRKESIKGILIPEKGLISITANRTGHITKLTLMSKQFISNGEPILEISSETHLVSGANMNKKQIDYLNNQIDALNEQLNSQEKLERLKAKRLKTVIGEEQRKSWQIRKQLNVIKDILSLKEKQFEHAKKLAKNGYLTQSEQSNSEQKLLLQAQNYEILNSQLLQQDSNIAQMKHELESAPLIAQQSTVSLKNRISALQGQLLQLTSKNQEQVVSPIDGNVSNILVKVGQQVSPSQLLATITPKNSLMEAELYLPSRASGFIKEHQLVKIRYEAFPYQRYGVFHGRVKTISKSILSPNDIQVSIPLTESVYKVTVTLDKQSVDAFGERYELQAGMQLEAEIILDTMSLFDWLMMPIYAIKGNW